MIILPKESILNLPFVILTYSVVIQISVSNAFQTIKIAYCRDMRSKWVQCILAILTLLHSINISLMVISPGNIVSRSSYIRPFDWFGIESKIGS